MKQMSAVTEANAIASISTEASHTSKGELVVKGVATALAAATIIETGKGVMTRLAKHPLIMFSMGITAGFFVHKYRKEIISITSKTAEQSKDFVLRQKENLKDLLAETQEDADDKLDTK